MTAKSTVDQYVVTPATVQATTDGALYVARQTEILNAAAAAAAALIAQGRPEGVPVAAIVPVLLGLVTEFPPKLAVATAIAQVPFA